MPATSRSSSDASEPTSGRLDKWLWAVRVFKTRAIATDACRRGEVEINGLAAKPARDVHPGETIIVRLESLTRTLRVVANPRSRIGAKLVPEFCIDLTPASELARGQERHLSRVLGREKGSGRPTKRERRLVDRLWN